MIQNTFKRVYPSRMTRVSPPIVVLLAIVLLLGSLSIYRLNSGSEITVNPVLKAKSGALNLPENTAFQWVRTAHAVPSDGELDLIADVVYGQTSFITNTVPVSATSTSLNQPNDIFVFDTGQIFVSDTKHNRVLGWNSVDEYEIGDPADIVLGQPDFDSSDAPNPPTAASMNGPTGITMGFDGILYVSDANNNRVLVFIPFNICDFYEYYDDVWCKEDEGYEFSDAFVPEFESGMEADYALGQPMMSTNNLQTASLTSLNHPMGIVTDADDNLIVADQGNNRVIIYEWPIETGGEASWIIGQEIIENNGNATFNTSAAPNPPNARSMNGPTGVAVDTAGNELYVADTGNNRILVFTNDPIDNIADRVIGQPDFVSNSPNAGGINGSSLNRPTGLKTDAGNRLFVADTDNHRVLIFDQVNPDGAADGVIGQPDLTSNAPNNGGLSGLSLNTPTGIATDALFMDAYVADGSNNRVLHYVQPLTNPTPAVAELDPGIVRVGSDGFTLDIWGSGIQEETMIEINGVQRSTGSAFLGLAQVDISAAELKSAGQITVTLRNPAPGGGVSAPAHLTIFEPVAGDEKADSVLGQQGFNTNDGAFSKLAADTLFEPGGVVVDPNSGRVFVADTGNARILSWPSDKAWADGAKADLVIGEPDFTTWEFNVSAVNNVVDVVGLALDSQGNLYAADGYLQIVQVYSPPFANGMAPSLTIVGLNNPLDLGLDSQDNLYVADTFNHRILFYEKPFATKDITPDKVYGQADITAVQPNRGGSITAETLHYPSGLALDASDNLYVSDSKNHRLLVYLAGKDGDTTADHVFGQMGGFTTGTANKGGISANSLNYPYGLVVDRFGNLYVADADNNRVLGYENPLATDQTADLVLGQAGSFVQNRANQTSRDGENASAQDEASLNEPLDVGVTANGDLFIVDYGNNRVLGFRSSRTSIFLPLIIK